MEKDIPPLRVNSDDDSHAVAEATVPAATPTTKRPRRLVAYECVEQEDGTTMYQPVEEEYINSASLGFYVLEDDASN